MARRKGQRSRSKPRARGSSRVGRRAQIVWSALVATMTVVGGSLYALDASVRHGGVGVPTITPLYARSASGGMEAVFENLRGPLAAWKSIRIVHSRTPRADAASLERKAHFVIGNGNGLGDGELALLSDWASQGPVAGDGEVVVCLSGHGDRGPFSDTQRAVMVELVTLLSKRLGVPSSAIFADAGRFFDATPLVEALAR